MKLPSTPPSFKELIESHREIQLGDKPSTYFDAVDEINRKYMTWDEVRRRDNLDRWKTTNPKTLWLLVKLGRIGSSRQLPFRDKNGRPFQFSMNDGLLEGLHYVDKYATGEMVVPDEDGLPPTKQYVVNSTVEEAISSSILEGAATTRKVAKEMIRSGREPRNKGERMALNNYLTLKKVTAYLRANPKQRLTLEILHDLHRTIAAGTLEDDQHLGTFRTSDDIYVMDNRTDEVLHVPPQSHEIPARMKGLLAFANDESGSGFIHPVVRGMILHFMLGYNHPYVDGNGRIARALFYWYLLRRDYWTIEYLAISQAILKTPGQYKDAYLHSEADEGDLTYFLLYHVEMINRAIEQFQQYVAKKRRELKVATTQLKKIAGLNHRQIALLAHALRHPDAVYSINGHAISHGVTRMTSRQDLYGLVDMKLLEHHKIGRRVELTVPDALPDFVESKVKK